MNKYRNCIFTLIITFISVSAYGQTYNILYSCDAPDAVIRCPIGLTLSGSTLYGTACFNSVFEINTDGSNFNVLHTFEYGNDGGNPQSRVILDGSTLYGTASNSGIYGGGTTYKMAIDGTDFSVMHSFGGANDGHLPINVIINGCTLYGTTYSSGPNSGSSGGGTIYKINTDNTGYAILHQFYSGVNDRVSEWCSSGLVLCGSTLYGSSFAPNRIYKINTDGTGFGTVYQFTDGTWPGKIVLSGSRIYGITSSEVFTVNTDGTDFEILHSFQGHDGNPYFYSSALIVVGSTIYGTTCNGGNNGCGVIYQMDTHGNNFTVLHSFDSTDGKFSKQDLVFDNNTLYGTTYGDNLETFGKIYSLAVPEPSSFVILGIFTIALLLFCCLHSYGWRKSVKEDTDLNYKWT